MEESPVFTREDVTVSLDRDLIDEMLSIAEVRGITLSGLVRDVLGAFCRAFTSGTDWTCTDHIRFQQIQKSLPPVSGREDEQDQTAVIISRILAHDSMIASLQSRVALLETGYGSETMLQSQGTAVPAPAVLPTVFQPPFPPASQSGSVSGKSQISDVIDCDLPVRDRVSDDALVKIRPPVSPVITSVDLTTIGRIDPQRSYSQTEAAALLSISLSTIRKYVKEGRVPSQKVGRSIIFQGKDLIAVLQSLR